MKTLNAVDQLAIREKIWRATGQDPGAVHPGYFLSATRGGITAGPSTQPTHKRGMLEVDFQSTPPEISRGRLEFNLN